MIVFISGLPGSGKSTVGKLVAEKLSWNFVESDTFLTKEMKEQIQKGELLSPAQLDSWVMESVIPNIIKLEQENPIVVSGLLAEEKYVKKLTTENSNVLFINLSAPYEVLKKRVTSRNHFAKEEMLNKCWEFKEKFTLPGPTIDATLPVEEVVQKIVKITTKL